MLLDPGPRGRGSPGTSWGILGINTLPSLRSGRLTPSLGPLHGAKPRGPEDCYITGVGNKARPHVLYSPSTMTTLPQASGDYYFPPTNMIHADWINIALCAAKRGGDNVLDGQRWTREYYGYLSVLNGKVIR